MLHTFVEFEYKYAQFQYESDMLMLTFPPFSNRSIVYSGDITCYGGETIILADRSVCEVSELPHDEVRPVL